MRVGQISMEYLLVVTFAFLLIVPIILITLTQQARFSQDVTAAQVQKIGNQIIDTVDSVYYAGPPAKRTMKMYFPDNILNISIEDTRLTFTVSGDGGHYEYVLFAAGNMTGSLRPFSGIHTVIIEAGDTHVNVTD